MTASVVIMVLQLIIPLRTSWTGPENRDRGSLS